MTLSGSSLEYAEKASASPAEVSDELAARLRALFSNAEIVELAAWVALENLRSRFNAGLGLHSQGFSESCEIPLTFTDTATSRPTAVA